MNTNNVKKYNIQLSVEEIRLPPFEDILILGKKSSQGKIGVYKAFELMGPDEFELVEIEDENIDAIFINKRVLKKMPKDRIVNILKERVFDFVSPSEIVKVDFKLKIIFDSMEEE